MEVRGEGEQESVFIVEQTEESSEESSKQTASGTNVQIEIQMSNLKSEINFLKN